MHCQVPDTAQRTPTYPELGRHLGSPFILRYSGRVSSKEWQTASTNIYSHGNWCFLTLPWFHDTLSCIFYEQVLWRQRQREPLLKKALVMVSSLMVSWSKMVFAFFPLSTYTTDIALMPMVPVSPTGHVIHMLANSTISTLATQCRAHWLRLENETYSLATQNLWFYNCK